MEKIFELKILTPFREFYFGKASKLNTQTQVGKIGILYRRLPLIAELRPAITEFIKENGEKVRFFSSEGILKVVNDKVYMYCDTCQYAEEIDISRAKQSKLDAEERLKKATEYDNIKLLNLIIQRAEKRIELMEKKHE
ncbi:F0F1 ATP synthase subunit epsilon [Clostridium sediminicola]|uniref:ATP synthase F1 subunit epsilon n=1 Tax=Clostridium sediminicola TaxID=3114879 RepID=UPI0031F22B99